MNEITKTADREDDDQVLDTFRLAALAMFESGFHFAKGDNPEAFAKLHGKVREGAMPRLELTLTADKAIVRGLLVDAEDEVIAQVFVMDAEAIAPSWGTLQ